MGSSLPVSELELEAQSAISKRAEPIRPFFCFLDYVRIVNVNVLEIASKRFLLRKRPYEIGRHKSTTPKHRSQRVRELFSV